MTPEVILGTFNLEWFQRHIKLYSEASEGQANIASETAQYHLAREIWGNFVEVIKAMEVKP